MRETVRFRLLIDYITIYYNNILPLNHNDKLIIKWLKSTRKFIKEYPEIFITKADKDSVTVMDKDENIFLK